MKTLLSTVFVFLSLTSQAHAGYMLSTVCLDTKGGAYLTERTVCYNAPGCDEIQTPLSCVNQNCANPKIDLSQLDPKGPAASINTDEINKLTTQLEFIMLQSKEEVSMSPVYSVAADGTTLVCAPAMTASDFDSKGVEAKITSY